MKFYVEYKTKAGKNSDWQAMPHKVPVDARESNEVRPKFERIFRQCFGNTLEYRIISIEPS